MANQAKVAQIYAELQLSTAKFKAAIGEATNESRRFSAEMRKSSEEARGSIALLGEEIGVRLPRHLRSFVAELPGVGKAMSAAFEAIAVIALIDVVVEAGKKIYEFVQKNEEAARKNKEAWEGIATPIRDIDAGLRASNARIEDSIAKLEHKPTDGLKTALLEAADAAQKLGEKLDADINKTLELTKQEKVSLLDRLTGGGQTDIDRTIAFAANQYKSINPEYQDILSRAAARGDQGNYNQARQDQLAALHRALDPQIATLADYLREHQDLAGTNDPEFIKAKGGYDSLTGILNTIQDQATQEQGNQKQKKLEGSRDANAALEQEDAKRLKAFGATLAREKSLYGMSVAQERAFWESRLKELHSGTGAYDSALAKFAASSESLSKAFERIRRSTIENAPLPITAGNVSPETQQRQTEVSGRLSEQQAKMNASLSEASTKYQLATGQINAHTAAIENAAAHEDAFNASLKVLRDELAQLQAENSPDALLSNDERAKNVLAQQQLNAQIAQLNAAHRDQQLQDALATESAFDQVFDHLRKGAQDISQKVASVMEHTLDGINDQFVNAIFGDKTNFHKVFQDSEKSLAKVGIQWAEGILTGKKSGSTGHINDLKLSATDGALNVHIAGSSVRGNGASGGGAPFSSIPGVSSFEDTIKNSPVGQFFAKNGSTLMPSVMGTVGGLMSKFDSPAHAKGEGSGVANAVSSALYKQNALSRFLGGSGSILSGVGGSMFGAAGGSKGFMSMLNDSNGLSSLFGGKLFGSGSFFGGNGFATGGDVTYGGVYPVGELGPENVYLPGGSHVTPNKDIGGGAPTYNIDARGTDPALTQANVARAIASSNAHAVSQAQAKIVDRQRRTPHG